MTVHQPFPALNRNESSLTVEQRIDAAYRKGMEDGLLRGQQEGYDNAMQTLRGEMDERCQRDVQQKATQLQLQHQSKLDAVVASLQQRLVVEENILAEGLFTLLQQMVKLVLDAELSRQPQLYIQALKAGLEQLQGREQIEKIFVSVTDGQWLNTQKITQINGIDVGIDASLKTGEALFDCGNQVQQLSFDMRLDEVMQQIKPVLVNAD